MNKEFLGTGWNFPIRINKKNNLELVSTSDDNLEDKNKNEEMIINENHREDIRQAILIILNTTPGERVMRPRFGCGINNHVFSVINNSNLEVIKKEVEDALLLYEPRIELENIEASVDINEENKLIINIEYTVKSFNSRHNLVYPFYLTERG